MMYFYKLSGQLPMAVFAFIKKFGGGRLAVDLALIVIAMALITYFRKAWCVCIRTKSLHRHLQLVN